MNEALAELMGRRVQVWSVGGSQGGFTDDGVLEAYADPWLRLRKADGDLLCFPVYHVRLVKLLDRLPRDRHLTTVSPELPPGEPDER